MDVDQFRSIELFQGLTDDELELCAEPFTELQIVTGSSLAKQDDFAYKFFVVLEGEVDVHRDFKFVARLGPGEIFGERALIKGEKRNARVTAHTHCRLACMMSWEFSSMIKHVPTVAARINAIIDAREG